jgi:hypothetical protein
MVCKSPQIIFLPNYNYVWPTFAAVQPNYFLDLGSMISNKNQRKKSLNLIIYIYVCLCLFLSLVCSLNPEGLNLKNNSNILHNWFNI